MEYPLEERIGERELFTNREKDLAYFYSWIDDIEKKAALSNALISHRKVGKTTLIQRLYNELYARNGKVIPFFFELKEDIRVVDELSRIYYMSFISQLLSFKKRQWLGISYSPKKLFKISKELRLDHVAQDIKQWHGLLPVGGGVLWDFTREAPHRLAELTGDRFLVIIDEFQYFNQYIYRHWPATPENQAMTFAGNYLGTAESKVAPMLITGSQVGMLMKLIYRQLPKRFEFYFLEKFEAPDFLELGYKLSALYGIPTTDECLLLAHRLLGGHAAYLRDVFRSKRPEKDLTTPQGLYETFLFEAGNPQGRIRAGWEEYLEAALDQINQAYAKKIVLFLAKHREQEWTRPEIKERCGLSEMDDRELQQKLQALVAGDIIAQGRSNFDYQGLGDPTFDKVFRTIYEKEIEQTSFEAIQQDMIAEFERAIQELRTQLTSKTHEANVLRGKLNQKQGEIGELWVKSILRYYSERGRYFAPGELGDNAEKIRLPRFREIEAYAFTDPGRDFKVDIFCQPAQAARASESEEWFLAVEVKNRHVQQVGIAEVETFANKLQALQAHRGAVKLQGLFYSCNGFHEPALTKLRELGIWHWDFAMLNKINA